MGTHEVGVHAVVDLGDPAHEVLRLVLHLLRVLRVLDRPQHAGHARRGPSVALREEEERRQYAQNTVDIDICARDVYAYRSSSGRCPSCSPRCASTSLPRPRRLALRGTADTGRTRVAPGSGSG